MGKMQGNVIEIPDDYEDIAFLTELEAVEAQALSRSASKRRRVTLNCSLSPPSSAGVTATNPNTNLELQEGPYTAALKGSRSLTWHNQSSRTTTTAAPEISPRTVASGSACFKCGMDGHWARDCNASGSVSVPGTSNVVAKECSCGVGTCLVLTANTERNRGRKFFKCPVRQENGGCGFFEWCDESSGGHASVQGRNNSGGHASVQEKAWNDRQQDSYQRSANKGITGYARSWDEYDKGTTTPKSAYGAAPKFETRENKGYGVRTSSSCFKCGEEEHWARDCLTTTSSNMTTGVRGKSSSSDECYKCGQSGHWAKDCSQGQTTKFHYQ